MVPRIRRIIEPVTATVFVLMTSSQRHTCDVMSDASLPAAILLTSQTDCRMEKSHLGYLLRQKVIDIETETQEANDSMVVAVNWLNRLSIHFEEFVQRIDSELHFSTEFFNEPVLVRKLFIRLKLDFSKI